MKFSLLNTLLLVLLFAGLALELSLQTSKLAAFGNYRSPALWMLSGLVTCAAGWGLLTWRKTTIPTVTEKKTHLISVAAMFILFLGLAIWIGQKFSVIYGNFEISQYNSDIIPSIQLYVRRLLGNETVYMPLVFDGWTVLPTYFPMMWLPYIFSEILEIDYRWTAYAVFLLGLSLYFFRISKQNIPLIEKLFKVALPFWILAVFVDERPEVFGHAVEIMPIGFYFLLCFGLFNTRRPWIFALGILFCFLSRYAFTLWLPLALLIYWIEYGFKSVFKLGMMVLAGVFALYIIPFLSKNWDLITDGLAYYDKTAIRQWSIQSWQIEGEKPYHLFRGLSFTSWFYDNTPGDALAKLNANKVAHRFAAFGASFVLAAGYFILKKSDKKLNVRLYLLVGLKFYLVFFYGFIYVPFAYLFMLPLFISLPIIYEIPLWNTVKGLQE